MTQYLRVLAVALGVSACSHPAVQMAGEPAYMSPNGPVRTPYTPVVQVGNLLYLSGQVGVDANGALMPGGLQVEARQALNNMKTLLEKSNSSLDRAVKCTVFLADMSDYATMNEIYVSYFTHYKPARTTVAVAALPLGARIEIECIAAVNP